MRRDVSESRAGCELILESRRGHVRTPVRNDVTSVVAIFEAGLRAAGSDLWLVTEDGRRTPLPVTIWRGPLDDADRSLLVRCDGPTLDVGCGPGRFAAALAARGIPALGIDVAPAAVAMTRRLGGIALCRDVFDRVPAEGRWRVLLLADGNVGIGGDPVALLRRADSLICATGRLLVEVDGPGAPTGQMEVRLAGGSGAVSEPFGWARVGVDGLPELAMRAGLSVTEVWPVGARYFAALERGTNLDPRAAIPAQGQPGPGSDRAGAIARVRP
ncbi:MAG: class I SAM-dependent methyltransferase [Frankia sp.]